MASGAPPSGQTTAPIENLPTVYTEPAQTQHSEETVDIEFLKGPNGILKVIEMIFSLITFICASVSAIHKDACGWIQFVSMTAFILTVVLYILYTFKLPPKLAKTIPFKFSELVYYITFTVFYFISGIVAACFAYRNDPLAAASFFSFASMVTFGVDDYFRYMSWRHSNEGPFFSSAMTQGVTLP